MLKVRLQRVGRKNDPSFRVVVTDSKNGPKSGKFIEVLGSYDARKGEPIFKAERIKHWLSVGAQASGTLHNLLVDKKIIDGKKINVLPKKTKIVKPVEAESAPKVEIKEEVKVEEAVAPELKEAVKIEEAKPEMPEMKAEEVVAHETKIEEAPQVETEIKPEEVVAVPEVEIEAPVTEETAPASA